MSNKFDSVNYPVKEPTLLIAGDRWVWKRTDLGSDYPPADYALTYSARLEGAGTTEIEIAASESGNDYLVEIASATTAAYTVGTYRWQAYITRSSDSERLTIDLGYFEVRADRDTATTDPRTHAQITLTLIETAIEGLNLGVKSYTINGRTMTINELDKLVTMRKEYKAEVNIEQQKANGTKKNILVYRL